MAINLAEKWSPKILERFEGDLVVSQITNKDYEGEVSGGNAVNIFGTTKPAITDYKRRKDNDSSDADNILSKLLIDQEKWGSIRTDVADVAQLTYDQEKRAIYDLTVAFADEFEASVFKAMYGASPKAAAETLDSNNIDDAILEARKILSSNKVPKTGRWIVLTPETEILIYKSSKFIKASDMGQEMVKSGQIGKIYGFEVYESTFFADADVKAQVMFGCTAATTVANQISKLDAVPVEKGFGTLIKGLHVYGRKVARPEGLYTIPKA